MRPAVYLEGLIDLGSCHWSAGLSSSAAGLLSVFDTPVVSSPDAYADFGQRS